MSIKIPKVALACLAIGLIMVISLIGYKHYKKVLRSAEYAEIISGISRYSGHQNKETFHERIDALRHFIVDHTSYDMNEEFYKTWRDDNAMAQNILNYLNGSRPDQPPFECASRRGLMASMLNLEGIQTRNIDVYDSDNNLSGHSFLEVFNPETEKWEIQDPAFDVIWQNKKTGQRASIHAVLANLDNHHPCGRDTCGWNIESIEKVRAINLKDWLKIVSVINKAEQQRFSVYASGVDPAAIYNFDNKKGTFCEVVSKNCRNGFSPITQEE